MRPSATGVATWRGLLIQVSLVTHLGGAEDLAAMKLTLTSLVLHTPYDLYDEIIVIDDGMDSVDAQHALATFMQDSRFNKASATQPPTLGGTGKA